MSIDELEKLFGEAEKETPKEPSKEEPKVLSEAEKKQAEESKRKEEQLANLNKAIGEANSELVKIRKITKQAKSGEVSSEEELPKINMEEPGAKAWDKHIREKVDPLRTESEKEKEEVFTFALREFLADKPGLSSNSEKLKQMIGTYERIKTASGRTREGVQLDLQKAYAAEFYPEILEQRRKEQVDQARADAIYSDIAVTSGATAYSTEKSPMPKLSEDDKAILAKWNMTPEEWIKLKVKK